MDQRIREEDYKVQFGSHENFVERPPIATLERNKEAQGFK